MASLTLANSPNPHPLSAESVRPFVPPRHPKPRPEFRVFPTGKPEYHWRIVAVASNQTISRHKSLTFALRKCTQLNKQRGEGARNETK